MPILIAVKVKQLHFTFCHRRPDRSFFYKGKQFPVCARCTGIHVGYLTFPFFLFGLFYLNIWWTLALIAPTNIDGLTQAFCNRESNNPLRFITGVMAGVGTMSIVSLIGKGIAKQILLLIN